MVFKDGSRPYAKELLVPRLNLSLSVVLAFGASVLEVSHAAAPVPNPFGPLAVYNGAWAVTAEHPWSGSAPGSVDQLVSRCRSFARYFACEQTVNGKVQGLLVYSAGSSAGQLHSRLIAPDGLAAGRGDLTLDGNRWTYLDKPPAPLNGNWSRVENTIIDQDHIRFEEWESADQGKTWTKTNSGTEVRISRAKRLAGSRSERTHPSTLK